MSLVALGLVLGAAVSHATWNLAAKRASGGGAAFVWVYSVVSTLVYLPLAVVFAQPLSLPAFAVILLSGSVHLGYFLLLQRGYAVGDLSVVYPLARGTGPLLSVIAAIVILGDRPTYVALAGAGLVVAGILVIGTGAAARGLTVEDSPGVVAAGSGHRLAGAWYGLAAGVLIASYTLLDATAVKTFMIAPVFFDWTTNAMRLTLLTPYALRRRTRVAAVWRDRRREAFAVAVLGPLGYILVLYAFTLAPVSLVAPARELSIVVGALFGWWLLREPQPLRRLCGAAVVVAGVTALALS